MVQPSKNSLANQTEKIMRPAMANTLEELIVE